MRRLRQTWKRSRSRCVNVWVGVCVMRLVAPVVDASPPCVTALPNVPTVRQLQVAKSSKDISDASVQLEQLKLDAETTRNENELVSTQSMHCCRTASFMHAMDVWYSVCFVLKPIIVKCC